MGIEESMMETVTSLATIASFMAGFGGMGIQLVVKEIWNGIEEDLCNVVDVRYQFNKNLVCFVWAIVHKKATQGGWIINWCD